MNVRTFVRLAPTLAFTLACTTLALPGCDCAGNTAIPDAGDTGPQPDGGPPRDTGPDTGARDAGPDTAVDAAIDAFHAVDGGMCSNPETCNAMDDDCDGTVDENIAVSCGSNVGICRAGTQSCASGTLGACSGGVTAMAAEICGNGMDDDCDGTIDNGCTCTTGATQSCGSGVGECRRGTQTCAANAWGSCVNEVVPTAELCDGLDNNCDGMTDELFPGLGGACDGPDSDMCNEGMISCSADHLSAMCDDTTGDNVETCNGVDDNCNGTVDEGCSCTNGATQMCGMMMGVCTIGMQTCAAGAWGACSGVGPSAESCNGLDDNCDGQIDDGFAIGVACDGPDADMCNEGMTICNAGGTGVVCNDTTGDTVETCDGVDNDCDGSIDEGNPGGDVLCAGATDHGTCVSRTVCSGGHLLCRGTFVAVAGTASAPGSDVMPTSSITTAIANAIAIGGGVDVCVCDTAAAGASTYTENVTMVEGVSVLGGLDCTSWNGANLRTTNIQDVDADGVAFPAGITTATVLSNMGVIGFDSAGAGAMTAAVTITDASPTLTNDVVVGGHAANAMGLRIVHTAAAASPVVMSGTYTALGLPAGTTTAVSIEAATPHFTAVTIGGAIPSGPGTIPTTAYGVHCTDCGGTTFMAGTIGTGGATTTGYGFYGGGNLAGLTMTSTSVNGGQSTANGSASTGVRLESCMGAPTFTTVNAQGGFSPQTATNTTHTAFWTSGATCAPVVDGGTYRGCEVGVNCYGIDADTSSPVVVRNVLPGAGGAPVGIIGSTATADVDVGLRCRGGACASITNSQINAGTLSRSGPTGVGLWLEGSNPTVDSCRITGPSGGAVMTGPPQFYGALIRGGAPTLTNNVIHDGTHALRVISLIYDMTPSATGLVRGPIVANNTIDYNACVTCGPRVGLAFFSNAPTTPSGTFRNNIIHSTALGGATSAVLEANPNSDPLVFEHNALFDPTAAAGAGVYVDESTTAVNSTGGINALNGMGSMYSGNFVGDCGVNGTFHIGGGSLCLDTGTMTSCPAHDFEGDTRPQGPMCDIGADEH